MPRPEQKPPNKRILEIKEELVSEMNEKLKISDEIKQKYIVTFVIDKLANLTYQLEQLKQSD